MRIYRLRQHRPSVVVFLDIKAAYDTVGRNIVWDTLVFTNIATGAKNQLIFAGNVTLMKQQPQV